MSNKEQKLIEAWLKKNKPTKCPQHKISGGRRVNIKEHYEI